MNRFSYVKADSVAHAIALLSRDSHAQVIAGGTNIVDLMKYDVSQPSTIVDINALPLKHVELLEDGSLRIGALVANATLAYHPAVQERFPLLASALLAGASPQLRNAATTGGNLLQRTRCYYFYDPSTACNKRDPGSGCSAIGGVNRIHAILGASDHCIATHPSDMCVALAALDAIVEVTGPRGEREISFADFHRLPGDMPERDNILEHGEIVVSIRIPTNAFGDHHTYIKLRDRQSYAFALVSVAVGLTIDEGRIRGANVALGGVAHKPWRSTSAEALLLDQDVHDTNYEAFIDALLDGAQGQGDNDFKIPLARKAIVRALSQAVAGTPQSQSDKCFN